MRDDRDCGLTVVMSVHNGERYVRQAIGSILSQTFQDFEFLIINDASTDGTRDIILSYTDSHIRLLDNSRNIGLTRSLNRGLREARGAFIARMDADDVSLPGRLAAQIEALESSKADVCFCGCRFVDEESGRRATWSNGDWDLVRWRGLFANSYGLHPSAMFRKKAIAAIDGYDECFPFAQDYELWDRCVASGLKFIYLPEILLRYRWRRQGISKQFVERQESYARLVSFRAMRRLLPYATHEQLGCLRWLFSISAPRPKELASIGLGRCAELLESLRDAWMPHGVPPSIWNDVAIRLAYRLPSIVSVQDRRTARRLIFKGIRRSGSPLCFIRTIRNYVRGRT